MSITPKGDWQLEEPESYSPTKFYTRASDSKGHREEIRVKLPPDIYDAIGRIVRPDGKGPIPEYRTMQDFMRDAAVHRLKQLHDLGMVEGVENALRRQLAIEAILEHLEMQQRFLSTIERATPIVRSLVREGTTAAVQEAKRIVTEFYIQASSMSDAPYWQEKYISYLKSEFGDLLNDIEG